MNAEDGTATPIILDTQTVVPINTSANKKQKKIEEDYTMYEEVKDPDELEDIIEEEIEEESEDDNLDDNLLTSHEEREERRAQREELKLLKTQLMTIKERLAIKTVRIEEIKDTLKKSQLLTRGAIGMIANVKEATMVPEQDIIDEVVKEYENQEVDEEEEANVFAQNDDDEDEDYADGLRDGDDDDDEDGDEFDNGLEEIDPQVLKLQERIKFLRHRCVSSLGNQLFEKAYGAFQQASGKSPDEVRELLIKILGEESIGYWAIMDQIMFFEGILDEISTNESSN